MFVVFIAVIVVLVIIAAVAANIVTAPTDSSKYIAEAKQIQSMLALAKTEVRFFYVSNTTYEGLDMNYLMGLGFAGENLIPSTTMAKADWDGWPEGVADPYTGPYVKLGNSAGDQMRMIIAPVEDNTAVGIYILKKKVNTIPQDFINTLEKVLASDPAYVGA